MGQCQQNVIERESLTNYYPQERLKPVKKSKLEDFFQQSSFLCFTMFLPPSTFFQNFAHPWDAYAYNQSILKPFLNTALIFHGLFICGFDNSQIENRTEHEKMLHMRYVLYIQGFFWWTTFYLRKIFFKERSPEGGNPAFLQR